MAIISNLYENKRPTEPLCLTTESIDELLGKLSEVKLNLQAINELIEKDECLSAKDVAERLGVSVAEARRYMARPDFPKLALGNGYKVSSTALFIYNLSQRVGKDA